ncbi:fructose-bisphosphate aldolase class I [Candidatus Kaiserbacteria bacterium]|nr:fructose-bisphosphate aldolase class I [Candidatus Kaiserbacteria bacterium]
MTDLVAVARSLFAASKGILAADESVATATKHLARYGISAGLEMRGKFRDLFLGAPDIAEYLSGVILFSETFDQRGKDRSLFPNSLAKRGIAPGIKVDDGTEPFPPSPAELVTKGLFGLPERLTKYKKKGATFTKWRAVFRIDGDSLPTAHAIHENAKRLANYAKEAQMAGMVPILEPEVLYEGVHPRARAEAVLKETLSALFATLEEHAVDRASLVLKTSMALSGKGSRRRDTPEEVAESTLAALRTAVPRQLAGIVFLSGGQSPEQATENLAAIVRLSRASRGAPWPLSFSFARALQEEALAVWKGEDANVGAAREVFLARLKKVADAVRL